MNNTKKRIVVLDGYTLNPGDLDWNGLQELGETIVYDRTSRIETIEKIKGADIVLTNKAILDREIIESSPQLKYIGVMATGYNIVDVEAASERGVRVSNVAGYSTDSAAQHTFALILALCNKVSLHDSAVQAGQWQTCKDFSGMLQSPIELAGKTLGLIGFGAIGRRVAAIGTSFGMKIIANRRSKVVNEFAGVEFTDLENCLRSSDVLSLHCPLNESNKGLINRESLSLMKPNSFLINTSRGQLINEEDLAFALNNDVIAGVALDVLAEEPPMSGTVLISAKNCIITPHIAWATKASRERLLESVLRNISAFLAGETLNAVNLKAILF